MDNLVLFGLAMCPPHINAADTRGSMLARKDFRKPLVGRELPIDPYSRHRIGCTGGVTGLFYGPEQLVRGQMSIDKGGFGIRLHQAMNRGLGFTSSVWSHNLLQMR